MGVDVVGAVLGVVFQHEDGRLRPELAVADRLDDAAQGQVVVGHDRPSASGAGFVPAV